MARIKFGKKVGYTLRDSRGRILYVGITNDPEAREQEHWDDGKRGRLQVETKPMSWSYARRWEARKLAAYRRRNGGKNPPYNRTRSGGRRR